MEEKIAKKVIVITSIFEPTEAVRSFAALKDYRLIVVGDKKSPQGWAQENVQFIPVAEQEQMDYHLAKLLPYNHYCRKMLGYLEAIKQGAEYIIDTDDDNIPLEGWGFPSFENKYDRLRPGMGFINIYQLYSSQKIWPRGLPLHLINTRFELEKNISSGEECRVGIWQGLADEDPDVDAIYRLTSDEPCYFDKRAPVVLGDATITPFNTQNTMIRKELFVLMYLPTYVTFRFTDILRGLVAQPIMWMYGYQLGFVEATVIQKRNPHDYTKDFESEIPMYRHCEEVINIVKGAIKKERNISENLYQAYVALHEKEIVTAQELVTLDAWLKDIA